MKTNILKGLADLLYPANAQCIACQNPRNAGSRGLCPDCEETLAKCELRDALCLRCMFPLDEKGNCAFCRAGGLAPLQAGYAPFLYQGTAKTLIRRLKFHYEDEPARILGEMMAKRVPPGKYDALVPVPLHKKRLLTRGANQAELLARAAGPLCGLPVLNLLSRSVSTRAQTALSREERHRNVRDAFVLDGDARGLRLLLVDDVRTTGATSQACARVLLQGGARYVGVLTAAIATGGQDA